MKRENFDSTLPATRCTEQMRGDVEAVANTAGVDMADVIRDALAAQLPIMALGLGLLVLDDLEDDQVAALGLERVAPPEPAVPVKEDRSRGLFGGPPVVG